MVAPGAALGRIRVLRLAQATERGSPELRSSSLDWLDAPGSIDAGWIVTAILVVLVMWFVVFPLLFFVLDLLLVLLLAVAGMLARVFLRRPWIVEAETGGPPEVHKAWGVVGWRASREAVEGLSAQIAAGIEPDWRRGT